MDVLYRYKGGQRAEELRYSLRSLSNVEHGDVFMVGDMPSWVRGVTHIAGGQWRTKWEGLLGDLFLACDQLRGRTLLLMDDDFYVMADEPIVPMHAGALAHHLAEKIGTYRRTLQATHDWLQSWGIPVPLSYELHVPMAIDAAAMATILRPLVGQTLQARSLYGNMLGIGGRQAADVKARRDFTPAGDLLSTGGWHGALVPRLQAALPSRGAYERV